MVVLAGFETTGLACSNRRAVPSKVTPQPPGVSLPVPTRAYVISVSIRPYTTLSVIGSFVGSYNGKGDGPRDRRFDMGRNDDRDRNGAGRFDDGIDPETALEVFEQREDWCRPLTAADVADELGIARRTAHNKLNRLVARAGLSEVGVVIDVLEIDAVLPEPLVDTLPLVLVRLFIGTRSNVGRVIHPRIHPRLHRLSLSLHT